MPEEFEGDLAGAVFWGADLRGARFRDVDLTGARISHAWLVDVDIDALIDRFVINGVDVTAFVNERDPWYPLRTMLRPSDAEGLRAAWAALEAAWAPTLEFAATLPEARLHESVGGEWSFVQTLRHLVFAMDKWFTVPILGDSFHPMGLPHSGPVDASLRGVLTDTDPTWAQAVATHANHSATLRASLASLVDADLERVVDVIENGPHTVQDCLFTVFEEAFWHLRYARRDLGLG